MFKSEHELVLYFKSKSKGFYKCDIYHFLLMSSVGCPNEFSSPDTRDNQNEQGRFNMCYKVPLPNRASLGLVDPR